VHDWLLPRIQNDLPYYQIATRVWKRYGPENMMTTAGGFMIFRFNTVADMHGVLEKWPWMFGGKAIIL
jgi:hypothetical protein